MKSSWREYEIKTVSFGDKAYPKGLAEINDPPKLLYYKGNLSALKKTVSVVGSRRMTRYGQAVVEKFTSAFAQNRVAVISGFMYGVDTAAHWGAIENGGVTVAIFGSGLVPFYPPENEVLYTKILQQNGLIMSEYKPEQKPKLWMYPRRNRIVAALATEGVLVVEAAKKSGSLITALFAKKYGKKVYAVPGPITSSVSTGTNELLKKGDVIMVTEPTDILGGKSQAKEKSMAIDVSHDERQVYELLRTEALSVDELSAALGKSVITVGEVVSLMALRGIVAEAAGKYYALEA